jgi:hypothetical protein
MSLWTRLFRRATPGRDAAPIPVVLYTRAGCGLCDEMKEAVLGAGAPQAFTRREVDVDLDPELARRHGRSLPVLEIDGRAAFKVRLSPEEFRVKLARRARERERP